VGYVVSLGHPMLTTLSNISSTFVFRYARTAIKVVLMEFTDKLGFGQFISMMKCQF